LFAPALSIYTTRKPKSHEYRAIIVNPDLRGLIEKEVDLLNFRHLHGVKFKLKNNSTQIKMSRKIKLSRNFKQTLRGLPLGAPLKTDIK